MHTASLKLEVLCKRPDALVRLEAPCDGAWTDPLAVLVLLVSYMPLAHAAGQLKIGRSQLHRGCTDVGRWASKLQGSLLLVIRLASGADALQSPKPINPKMPKCAA